VLERVWPADQPAVLAVVDADGAPLGPPRWLAANEAVERFELEAREARLVVLTFPPDLRAPDGREPTACGLAFGGAGERLPSPSLGFESSLIQLEPGARVALERTATPAALDLHWAGCARVEQACGGFSIEALPLPAGQRPRKIVAVEDDRALLILQESISGQLTVAWVERGEVRPLPPSPLLVGSVALLEWDRRSFYLLLEGRARPLFRLDAAGQVVGPIDGPWGDPWRIGAGRDGTLVVSDLEGRSFIARDEGAAEPVEMPFAEKGLAVVSRDRILVETSRELAVWDGRSWVAEHTKDALDGIAEVAADAASMVAVGELEKVFLREPRTRRWRVIPPPFGRGMRLRAVTGLGDGRVLVAGRGGLIGLWDEGWCVIETPAPRILLQQVAASPSGRTAYAIGVGEEDGPGEALLRLSRP
jgi:hypothetical protein